MHSHSHFHVPSKKKKKPYATLLMWISVICRILKAAPELPDFPLALKPDEYQLPQVDPSWENEG